MTSRIRETIACYGLPNALALVCKVVYHKLRPRATVQHPFDVRHGVDTSGLIPGRKLGVQHVHQRHSKAYWGTAPSLFNTLMRLWQATLPADSRLEEYAFLDVGCGKGRVMMLASEFPFQQVEGVELDGELAQIATENMAVWLTSDHPCKNLHVYQADALTHSLPTELLLVFLFNPFDQVLMKQFVERILACSAERRNQIDLLYVTPDHAELFSEVPGIELLWSRDIPFSDEDASVDIFNNRHERCNLYRVAAGKIIARPDHV